MVHKVSQTYVRKVIFFRNSRMAFEEEEKKKRDIKIHEIHEYLKSMKVYCRRVVYSNRQSPKGVILDKKKRKINLEANFPVGTGFTVSMVPSVKYEEMVEGGSRPNLRQCLRRPRIHTRWTLSFLRDMFLKLADQRRNP